MALSAVLKSAKLDQIMSRRNKDRQRKKKKEPLGENVSNLPQLLRTKLWFAHGALCHAPRNTASASMSSAVSEQPFAEERASFSSWQLPWLQGLQHATTHGPSHFVLASASSLLAHLVERQISPHACSSSFPSSLEGEPCPVPSYPARDVRKI